MACVKPDGSLTELGRQGMEALARYGSDEAAAQGSGLPLYRVRMLSRALVEEGLLEERDGVYAPTPLGAHKLASTA